MNANDKNDRNDEHTSDKNSLPKKSKFPKNRENAIKSIHGTKAIAMMAKS